jgi:hypothetical protein
MQYRVISDNQIENLQTRLNQLANEGFRPILMSSVATAAGV